MVKKKMTPKPFMIPMPVVIIGTTVDKKPNYMAASYIGIMNYDPVIVAVSIGKGHQTNVAIEKTNSFSINIPSSELLKKTDYVGTSGDVDQKADVFTAWYGEESGVPLVVEAPIAMECKVLEKLEYNSNIYIAEVTAFYAEEKVLSDEQIDMKKVDPVVFTMPDNTYYKLGNELGTAWKLNKSE